MPVHIDGYSQAGSRPNCNPINKPHNGHIAIELCGPGMYSFYEGVPMKGLVFDSGSDGSKVSGLAINDFQVALEIGSDNVQVCGNFLGVAVDGVTPRPNKVSVSIASMCRNTCIGDGFPGNRNLISGIGEYSYDEEEGYTILGAITNFGQGTKVQGSTVNLTRCGDALILPKAKVGIYSRDTDSTHLGGPDFCHRVIVAGHEKANILCDATDNDLIERVLVGTNVAGTVGLGGGEGLVFTTSYMPESAPSGHLVEDSLFSGHERCGILAGHLDDVGPVKGLILKHIKAGTDITGEEPIPNGEQGICFDFTERAQIIESVTMFNLLNGLRLGKKAAGTEINSFIIAFNKEGGIKFAPIERQENDFEGRSMNTRVIGNGNNAATTPCGVLKTLPASLSTIK